VLPARTLRATDGTGIDLAIGHTTYSRIPQASATSPPLHDSVTPTRWSLRLYDY